MHGLVDNFKLSYVKKLIKKPADRDFLLILESLVVWLLPSTSKNVNNILPELNRTKMVL